MEALFNLHRKQPWLARKQTELFDLLEICHDSYEQSIVCDLLYRFCYRSSSTIEEQLRVIASQINLSWGLNGNNTLIVAVSNSRYSDSSQAILWLLKSHCAGYDGWSTNSFLSKLGEAVELADEKPNIILLDEFVGTGDTVTKAIKWIQKQLVERSITANLKLCALTSMEQARQKIADTGVEFFVPIG